MDTPTIAIQCDRCHRPHWSMTVSEATGDVVIDGPSAGVENAAGSTQTHRPRAYVMAVERGWAEPDADDAWTARYKLVCIGRKHPRHERVVTGPRVTAAYERAVVQAAARIAMSDI